MLIHCQRCQAVFSLQDGVAGASSNFKVECGRCALVFEATAPAKIELPAQTPATPVPRVFDPGALERSASADELARALKPRRPGDPEPRAATKKSPIWIVALGGLLLVGVGALVTRARLGGLPA